MSDKKFDIKKNDDGMLFIQKDGGLVGAVRFDEETYQVTGELVKPEGKAEYWKLTGTGDISDTVTGVLFKEAGGQGSTGKARPVVTGKIANVDGKVERRLAGWLREQPNSRFYSMSLSEVNRPQS